MQVEKLNALTSLRFFAAALIVVHHSQGCFGISTGFHRYFPTYQAVSFFFVLSGFILTYVYRSFDSRGQVRKFFIARIARIWPLHVATLVITLLFFHKHYWHLAVDPERSLQFYLTLVSNFFLIQAWIPLKEYFWSFNAVSWSISTEFAFYLLFPFLLLNIKKRWKIELIIVFTISMAVVILSMVAGIPVGRASGGFGLLGVININPVVRVFEFCMGMSAALFFDRLKDRYNPGLVRGTAIELILVCAVVFVMTLNHWFMSKIEPVLGQAGVSWVANGVLNSFFFAMMILFFAVPRGLVSKCISGRFFVFLGEISFSIYLLHQILIRVYRADIAPIDDFPGAFSYIYFWIILLTGSYLLWSIVEKPCRKTIVRLAAGSPSTFQNTKYQGRFSPLKILPAFVILLVLVLPVVFFVKNTPAIVRIGKDEARLISEKSPEKYRNVEFGDKFVLVGTEFIQSDGDKKLRLVWKAKKKAELSMMVAVHFLDKEGNIVGKADYFQSHRMISSGWVPKGAIWRDEIPVSDKYYTTSQTVGICIYKNRNLLVISNGPTDWNGKRLLIDLPRFESTDFTDYKDYYQLKGY